MPQGQTSKSVGLQLLPGVTITTATTLPSGTVGTQYTADFFTSGGSSNSGFTWSLVSGSIPPGTSFLTFTPPGALALRNIPNAAGTYTFTLKVIDTGLNLGTSDEVHSSAQQTFTVVVN
jgi:hypothetical protein